MSHVSFLCKLVPPLLKILFFTVYQPALQITDKMPSKNPLDLPAILAEIERKCHIFDNAGTL